MTWNIPAPALLVLALVCVPGAALGQPTEAQINAVKQNCRSDFMSKCSSVKPGGPEAIQCLKKNATSPGCRAAVDAIGAPPAQAAPAQPTPPRPAATAPAAPSPQAATPPAPAPAPQAAPTASPPPAAAAPAKPAPKATAPKTAPTPKPDVAAAPAAAPAPNARRPLTLPEMRLVRRSCGDDILLHCRGVRAGDNRVVDCLAAQEATLAPACRQMVQKVGR